METIINQDFQQLRDRLQLPRAFPPAVLAEAEALVARQPDFSALPDWRGIPFITIDPPTSRDLDQAYQAERHGQGYRVRYAIADVGFWVARGSALETEAWERGLTFYSPDMKTSLYPPAISEGVASLLPDALRPAIVFDFQLDERAIVLSTSIQRALVMSRAKLSYAQVGAHLAAERNEPNRGALAGAAWSLSLGLLEEIGRLRQQRESDRGGISLRIPAQQVERWTTALGGYRLAFEASSPVEEWNAQISLMTGITAAQKMITHGIGLLRTLEAPPPERLRAFRLAAQALGAHWPDGMRYDEFVRTLNPYVVLDSVLLHQAARVNGGARYLAFQGELPPSATHVAIAAPYAHVTAPLRRLADRYVLDLLIALGKGETPAPAVLDALAQLPAVMNEAEMRSRKLESAIVDFVEARLLQSRQGEQFAATVIGLREDAVIIQIADPPIRTRLPLHLFGDAPAQLSADTTTLTTALGTITLGQMLSLVLRRADPAIPALRFALA